MCPGSTDSRSRSSDMDSSKPALTFFGGAGFIARSLRRLFLGNADETRGIFEAAGCI